MASDKQSRGATSRTVICRWLTAAIAIVLSLSPWRVSAQEGGRAGLVVVTGEGAPITRCVDFEGDAVSGEELLALSGLDIIGDPQASMGTTICRIDGVGCNYPAQDCFCQCQGNPCTYWAYWRRDEPGEWIYSGMGASGAQVTDGALEGWVWGAGAVNQAPEPPQVTFDEICAPAPAPDAVAASVALSPSTQAAPAAQATPFPDTAPAGSGTGIPWLQVAGLALILGVPLAALALLRRRRSP